MEMYNILDIDIIILRVSVCTFLCFVCLCLFPGH